MYKIRFLYHETNCGLQQQPALLVSSSSDSQAMTISHLASAQAVAGLVYFLEGGGIRLAEETSGSCGH